MPGKNSSNQKFFQGPRTRTLADLRAEENVNRFGYRGTEEEVQEMERRNHESQQCGGGRRLLRKHLSGD